MKRHVLLLLLVVFVTSCAGGRAIEYEKRQDFSKYKTYAWHTSERERVADEDTPSFFYDKIKLRAEVAQKLQAKGFVEHTPDPDLLIVVEALVSRLTPTVNHHKDKAIKREGSLVLNFVDAQTREVIWKTWAVGVIYEPDNRKDEPAQTLADILEALNQFPPAL